MSRTPLVSVIVPFYNTPPGFMREAIESVLAQSYDRWELLLVDDGSTGDSSDLARQYADRHPQAIRYLEHGGHRNLGCSASRQLGVGSARGEYVAFLDADDLWLPGKLDWQVSILNAVPSAAMVYGNTQYWYSWAGKPENQGSDYLPSLGVAGDTLFEPPGLLGLFLQGRVAVPCTCSLLVRSEALRVVGGFEGITDFMYEDQMLYAKMALRYPIFVSEKWWERYRQHPVSGTARALRTASGDSFRLHYLKWVENYLRGQGCSHPDTWRILRRQLWLYSRPAWVRDRPGSLRFLRWTKKWLLRLEERLLPAAISRRVWTGEMRP